MKINKDHIQIEIFRNAWSKPRGDCKNKWINNESKSISFKSFQGGIKQIELHSHSIAIKAAFTVYIGDDRENEYLETLSGEQIKVPKDKLEKLRK